MFVPGPVARVCWQSLDARVMLAIALRWCKKGQLRSLLSPVSLNTQKGEEYIALVCVWKSSVCGQPDLATFEHAESGACRSRNRYVYDALPMTPR